MDDSLDLEFAVTYRHRIFFTEGAFAAGNRVLADLFAGAKPRTKTPMEVE